MNQPHTYTAEGEDPGAATRERVAILHEAQLSLRRCIHRATRRGHLNLAAALQRSLGSLEDDLGKGLAEAFDGVDAIHVPRTRMRSAS